MRVCAVSLPELRIELVRAEMAARGRGETGGERAFDQGPLAVVVAPLVQGEAVLTEQELLGNTRLSVVSREARALGVLPGHTLAQARARAGDLAVRVVRPDAVRDVLARLAEVGLAYGATVSFGMEGQGDRPSGDRLRCGARDYFQPGGAFGDIVWIDVTGCAHLHEPKSIFDGETILATRLARVIASLGHTCSVAIADGPRIAAMLARTMSQPTSSRSASRSRWLTSSAIYLDPIVVRPGDNARAVEKLPIAALPLPTEDVRWLTKIGVRTIGELRELPAEGLGTRLGTHAREVLSLAAGDDRAPLAPYVPPEVPEEEVELEYGIDGTQALTFVVKTLTDRLSARLQGRAVAASRVELSLHLDAAMLERTRDPREIIDLELPAPLSGASDLLAALRPKIERVALDAPVLRARLRAPVLVHRRALTLSLFEPEPKAERALPRLVGELVSDLGADRVSTLVLGDSWNPEDRSRLAPFGRLDVERKAKKRRHMLSSVPEPTRLLAEPRVVSRDSIRVTRQLSRLEAIEWWKTLPRPVDADAVAHGRGPKPLPNGARSLSARVDYVQAWTDDGEAWVEIDRTSGAARIRGWFD